MKDKVLSSDGRNQLEQFHPVTILLTLTVSKELREDHHVVVDDAIGEQTSALPQIWFFLKKRSPRFKAKPSLPANAVRNVDEATPPSNCFINVNGLSGVSGANGASVSVLRLPFRLLGLATDTSLFLQGAIALSLRSLASHPMS